MEKVKNILIRRILNSMGGDAYEAEVELESGFVGIASSPVAIEPGKREKKTTEKIFSYLPVEKIKNSFFSLVYFVKFYNHFTILELMFH